MVDPRVILLCAALAGGWYLGGQAVKGVKAVGHAVQHAAHHVLHPHEREASK
jgi:hypothetical protein